MSMTCLTSAGQVSGMTVIAQAGSVFETILSQFVINARYSLMSVSLSQKCDDSMDLKNRLALSYFITDEIFALSMTKEGTVGNRYLIGIATAPYFGWAAGTLFGALFAGLMPQSVRSALGIAIYGMFLAVFVKPAKEHKSILFVVLLSGIISIVIFYLFKNISGGFSVILCAVISSLAAAKIYPLNVGEDSKDEQ